MGSIDKITQFLSGVTDTSLGYNEINFFAPADLVAEQTGYSVHANGTSLVTGRKGDWQKEWIAIARDQTGDPVIVDTSVYSVLSAVHGEGKWEPFMIADSLEGFGHILSILEGLSHKRKTPVDLEKNPITEEECENALLRIERHNPHSELWFWEDFIDK